MTRVFLEVGPKRTFAAALDWPGWCRSGRREEQALEALAGYRPRFAPVAVRAGLAVPDDTFQVVETVPGNVTTDFGAPDKVAEADREPLPALEAKRIVALVEAAWAELDAIVAATPAQLRKGPRGGGRDRDPMVTHVLNAEASYGRMIGVRHRQPAIDAAAIAAMRADIVTALLAPVESALKRPVRYAARRIAWHVLDHAWEMQDRT